MIGVANSSRAPALDDPRGRMLWIVPLAIALWLVILAGFARVLEQSIPPAPEPTAVEARIVELPPQASAGPAASAPAATPPRALQRPAPIAHPRPVPRRRPVVRPAPPSPSGTARPVAHPQPAPAAASAPSGSAKTSPKPNANASGNGGAGIGGDAAGARAIYAPVPTIPDDLRQDAINAIAVAHFIVKADGSDEVVLSQPTANPELNQVLINTLKEWRFFPAIKSGVAIDSEFDVRIPITVN